MVERVYLSLDDVLYLHEEQLRLFGGAAGTRDEGLILSALLRPQTGYYADLIEEAAALWESLAMNHGFVDGNKRVAFASVLVFLGLNGLTLTSDPDDVIAFIYQHLEAGTFRKDVVDAWLRLNTGPMG
jgi:death-on-curing protein